MGLEYQIEVLLREMADAEASDLIITTTIPPQFRINGRLTPVAGEPMEAEDTLQLARSLLTEQQFQKLEQMRSVDFSVGFAGIGRFRVNAFYQRGSVALAIRMIPYVIPCIDELGLPSIVKQFAMRTQGLVLFTGPTGSGKSTSLAALIQYINERQRRHIVCIEDPIEYGHTNKMSVIEQREILDDAHTFQDAMRSVFRQDPDVVMIGEMRDLETISLALSLAETGHLILATLHTNDAISAIMRISSVFPSHEKQHVQAQLSMVLNGVIAQNLIETCDEKRRVLAYEVMVMNGAIANLIRDGQVQQMYSALQTGKAEGMITMNECLARLVQSETITPASAMERSPKPRELARMINYDDHVPMAS
ncbi:MAG: twitching motility protein PilT [Kiritimatiellia bacterium]|jgi:twitching motility protein PilT